MEPKIEICTDHCEAVKKEEIQNILDQVTALISAAVLRALSQPESPDAA